jgi:hypothetical protein
MEKIKKRNKRKSKHHWLNRRRKWNTFCLKAYAHIFSTYTLMEWRIHHN